ncbi:MAG TPA: 16S rRNA (cytidine(1402)-2'-O)-methyltransferase [Candidatus Limnocylindrales bacterium]|nr:16S rRNA (cytidine(1402)-2'-O)-methyltransferase [Candidatus Limnocylindrales bacterium]
MTDGGERPKPAEPGLIRERVRAPAEPGRGTLYVVATPIGNLRDVTLRALDVLAAVPLIAAEDTRLSRRLLDRYEIKTRAISFHVRSAPGRLEQLLEHLRGGSDLALVTDAGTPIVSDPGEDLVASWAAEGGAVVPIPGASAVLAAVVAGGMAGPRWGFEGFLPRSGRERRERLARVAVDDRATIIFEAPTRLGATLKDLVAACGAVRQAAVCRELTKLHEQIARGPLAELVTRVADGTIPTRGEVVIVVAGAASFSGAGLSQQDVAGAPDRARAEVDRLVAGGIARGEAARRVAADTGIHRRELYRPPEEPTGY